MMTTLNVRIGVINIIVIT